MFSHFSKSKGHLTFLESVNILLSRTKTNPGFKFLIVGFRDKRTWIKTLIKLMVFRKDYTSTILKYLKKKKLEKHVLLIPYTNNVFQILQAVDIVVRPSKSADPWGRDIIEAMAFGKPVIATGTSEFFIKNKITGYLVPPESPEKLAECLNSLILSPDLRQIMGTAGHNIIREMCDLDNFKESIKKVYHDLIK
jgi:glycosyltransferase involved in cell wall biosynthesis